MEWTREKLAGYLGKVRTTVEFRGVTGEELVQAFHDEAVMKLQRIAEIVCNEYQTDREKLESIADLVR